MSLLARKLDAPIVFNSTVRPIRRPSRTAITVSLARSQEIAEESQTEPPEAFPTLPAPPRLDSQPPTLPPPEPRGSLMPHRLVADGAILHVGMTPRQMFVLHLIDGTTSLDDIVAASGLDEREAIASVADLLASGMIALFD